MSGLEDWISTKTMDGLVRLVVLLGVAGVVGLIARPLLISLVRRLARRTSATWDDVLVEHRVFARMAQILPAMITYYGAPEISGLDETLAILIQRVSVCVIVVVTAVSLSAFLTAVNDIYSSQEKYRHRPIKGYLQVVKIIIYALMALVVISTLLDRSPWIFLSGIGAMTAVLLLIFRDTILSLVASVQIASNDMIHVGDWIEMPQAGADGDVIDVALHTVKVQNWDKTITTIPTLRFIDESFKNWRGMALSGGRRIKRAFHIDLASIRFLDVDEVARFSQWSLLADYIEGKRSEIADENEHRPGDGSISANIRRLTNVGTLRAYLVAYLRAHAKIHEAGYTLIVRQLAPGPTGLPLEIYCFTKDQAWDVYEGIQADIFDHIFAIVPEFGLRLFQQPTGADLASAISGSVPARPTSHLQPQGNP